MREVPEREVRRGSFVVEPGENIGARLESTISLDEDSIFLLNDRIMRAEVRKRSRSPRSCCKSQCDV